MEQVNQLLLESSAPLVTKTSGEVKILDIDIDENHSLAKKKLGVVGQEVNFNQFEKVGDIIRNQAGYYGLSFKQARDNAKVLHA